MPTKTNSNGKTRIPSVCQMTPEKYEALSPEMKRAYLKKGEARAKALEEKGAKRIVALNQSFCDSLVLLVATNPRLEWEIVHNYCGRNKKMLVERDRWSDES